LVSGLKTFLYGLLGTTGHKQLRFTPPSSSPICRLDNTLCFFTILDVTTKLWWNRNISKEQMTLFEAKLAVAKLDPEPFNLQTSFNRRYKRINADKP